MVQSLEVHWYPVWNLIYALNIQQMNIQMASAILNFLLLFILCIYSLWVPLPIYCTMGEAVGISYRRFLATQWYIIREGDIFLTGLADAIVVFWQNLSCEKCAILYLVISIKVTKASCNSDRFRSCSKRIYDMGVTLWLPHYAVAKCFSNRDANVIYQYLIIRAIRMSSSDRCVI